MIRRLLCCMMIFAAPATLRADGVADFLVNPAAGYTITASGSYRLAGDATLTTGTAAAIQIDADNVTLDLNGHTLTGPGTGTGAGIAVGDANKRITIRNGRIVGFGGAGIAAPEAKNLGFTLSDLTIEDCGGDGINVGGAGARVTGCTVGGCAFNGIFLQAGGAVVEDCVAGRNNRVGFYAGIYLGEGSVVRRCVANSNNVIDAASGSTTGIYAGPSSVVESCTANRNIGKEAGYSYGIYAAPYSVVANNTCSENEAGSLGNYGAGIYAGLGSRVVGNTCANNRGGSADAYYGIGIQIFGGCHVEGNSCLRNGQTLTAAVGYGRGIKAEQADGSVIRNNMTSDNDGVGLGTGVGIYFEGNSGLIEGNNATLHDGGPGFGITVIGTNNVIRANTTAGNLGSILITSAGNRSESNRCKEAAISAPPGTSLGAGDLADIGPY